MFRISRQYLRQNPASKCSGCYRTSIISQIALPQEFSAEKWLEKSTSLVDFYIIRPLIDNEIIKSEYSPLLAKRELGDHYTPQQFADAMSEAYLEFQSMQSTCMECL